MIAASNGSTETLKAMGRGPSLLNLKDADGGTAAMSAAVHKHSSVLDFVRLPHAQTDHFRTPRPARLPTRPRARDRTRGDKQPRSRSFPDRVPGNPRQRQNRWDFFSRGHGPSRAPVQAGIEPATYLFEIRRGEKAFSAKKPFAASDDVSPDLDPSSLPVNPQLIEKKVDLNAQDSDGWTALMYAVTVGGAEAVSKLVAAGVDQSAKNADGDTAMDLAKANAKRHNLIQILDPKEPKPTEAE